MTRVLRKAEVSASVALADGMVAAFSDKLEVSLDCCVCQRCHRTVNFDLSSAEGKCTPTGHSFPGKVVGMLVEPSFVVYQLEYWYEPFIDIKHPDTRLPTGLPTWGRIVFEVGCAVCGALNRCSMQTNIVRPWTCRCKCGEQLYIETDEMPILSPSAKR